MHIAFAHNDISYVYASISRMTQQKKVDLSCVRTLGRAARSLRAFISSASLARMMRGISGDIIASLWTLGSAKEFVQYSQTSKCPNF